MKEIAVFVLLLSLLYSPEAFAKTSDALKACQGKKEYASCTVKVESSMRRIGGCRYVGGTELMCMPAYYKELEVKTMKERKAIHAAGEELPMTMKERREQREQRGNGVSVIID